jgi:hypothetical protein
VIADIGKLTIDSLEKFGIPYDELVFGESFDMVKKRQSIILHTIV